MIVFLCDRHECNLACACTHTHTHTHRDIYKNTEYLYYIMLIELHLFFCLEQNQTLFHGLTSPHSVHLMTKQIQVFMSDSLCLLLSPDLIHFTSAVSCPHLAFFTDYKLSIGSFYPEHWCCISGAVLLSAAISIIELVSDMWWQSYKRLAPPYSWILSRQWAEATAPKLLATDRFDSHILFHATRLYNKLLPHFRN